ncbi:CG12943, partial [Drosophila busckii]
SNCDAFISLLKSVIGTGILAMPYAFMYTGIIVGVVLTALITVLLIYGMQMLIRCMVECARRNKVGYMTYPESMQAAFADGPDWCSKCAVGGKYMVDIVLGFSHYGVNVVYVVFVAKNVKQFTEAYSSFKLDLRIYIAIAGMAELPLFLLRHLKYLVPINIIANILLYICFAIIFYYLFRGLPSISDREMFESPLQWPMFFGIVLFAVTSVGVMLAIEEKMAKPQKYLGICGILSLASIVVVISNLAFGIFGYWRYGQEILDSVTLNLPETDIPAVIVKLGLALAIFCSYPLSGYVTIDIIMNHCLLRNHPELEHPVRIEYILRVVFVFVCTLNAVAFPNLGPLLALIGAFSISLLNLVFPSCMDMCLWYKYSYGKLKWILIKDIFILIIGMLILLLGSFVAILGIVKEY